MLSHPRRLVSAAVVILSILILLSAVFGQHGYMALRKQQEELKQAEQERERARAEQLRLKKELDELRSPQGIERVAREEIKLAKPGEIIVTLPDSKGTATPGDQNSKPKDPSNNPQGANRKETPKDR
ncbi:MAG: cell division protein FtsL [Acidobacteriia bacterium]|nr:cell division protein FtsL [Terriglobia bacterium]